MAGFAIRFDVEGLENAERILKRVENLGEDPRPLLLNFAAVLESSTLRRFDEEKGPGGIPWPKSKPALGLAPRASGKKTPGKTLTDTGDLRDSIRTEVRPNEVEIGSDGLKNPVKAIANQEGSHRQTVVLAHTRVIDSAFGVPLPEAAVQNVRAHGRVTNLPARAFVGIDADDISDMEEVGLDYLQGLFR